MNHHDVSRIMSGKDPRAAVRFMDRTTEQGRPVRGAKAFTLPLFASEAPDLLCRWMEATACIPEFHGALLEEWHSRNFSQDEADTLNGRVGGYIRIHSATQEQLEAIAALDLEGGDDEA